MMLGAGQLEDLGANGAMTIPKPSPQA